MNDKPEEYLWEIGLGYLPQGCIVIKCIMHLSFTVVCIDSKFHIQSLTLRTKNILKASSLNTVTANFHETCHRRKIGHTEFMMIKQSTFYRQINVSRTLFCRDYLYPLGDCDIEHTEFKFVFLPPWW